MCFFFPLNNNFIIKMLFVFVYLSIIRKNNPKKKKKLQGTQAWGARVPKLEYLRN